MNRRRPSHLRLHIEDASTPESKSKLGGKPNSAKSIGAAGRGKMTSAKTPTSTCEKPIVSAMPASNVQERIAPGLAKPNPIASMDEVTSCLQAFAVATGWAVRSTANRHYSRDGGNRGEAFVGTSRQVQSTNRAEDDSQSYSGFGRGDVQTSAGTQRWRLIDASPRDGIMSAEDLKFFPTVTLEHAEELLGTIERLVHRLEDVEAMLRRQEAELATNVSVTRSPDEQHELADRLENILSSATKGLQSSSAAIYLLDESTSQLKMRSCHGLPPLSLAKPPRLLRGSLADLEALMGNAVLLEDTRATPQWESPEDFPSALVVPIGSASMPHGTVWFWSDENRKYTSADVEIANLAAGRIMSELEQMVLGIEAKQAVNLRKQLNAANEVQMARLPDSQPLHAHFQIDGWTMQNGAIGGGFHDWDMNPNSMIVAALGSANRNGAEGALIATSIQSTIRTLWPQNIAPSAVLRSANDVLWQGVDQPWNAACAAIQINPETGYGSLSMAGDMQAFIISERGFRPIGAAALSIASQPESIYTLQRFVVQPGEAMVVFSGTVIESLKHSKPSQSLTKRNIAKVLDQNELLQSIRCIIKNSAADIAGQLLRLVPTYNESWTTPDRSLIVIKNSR